MNYYAQIDGTNRCVAVSQLSAPVEVPNLIGIATLDESLLGKRWNPSTQKWEAAPAPPPPPDPAEWLIDIGPFFDRFGAAKLALLASTDATVRALVTDLQVRKWIDLQRPDVAQGIDLLVAMGVPGVTNALKWAVLTTPVEPHENLALRRTFFA